MTIEIDVPSVLAVALGVAFGMLCEPAVNSALESHKNKVALEEFSERNRKECATPEAKKYGLRWYPDAGGYCLSPRGEWGKQMAKEGHLGVVVWR